MDQKMRARGDGLHDLLLGYSIVTLLEWHLEQQRRRKMQQAQLRGIMKWISPPTAPALLRVIILVKSLCR